MEIKSLETDKNIIKAVIVNATHKTLNLLQSELLNEEEVTFASYKQSHPLKEEFEFIVKTNKRSPKTVLISAIDSAMKKVNDLKKEISSSTK